MKLKISRFKSIESAELNLEKINVLVGGNNSGKSSIIHALQLATSCSQTIKANSKSDIKFKKNRVVSTMTQDELFYSPSQNVLALGYDNSTLPTDKQKAINVKITDKEESAHIIIRKGKNKNLSVSITGEKIGKELCELDVPYSMYVPGLAGIAYEEQYIAIGAVRRAAARGDSNNILRNILFHLSQNKLQFDQFITTLRTVFPDIDIEVNVI